MKEIKTGTRGTRPRRAAGTWDRRPPRRRTPRRGRRACADQTLRRPRRWRVSAQSRCQVKYQRKSPGRRDAHARVAGHLAAPLPADDARVLRRSRRPGAAGLRLGPGDREARELRDDVCIGVLHLLTAHEAGRGRRGVRGSVRCQRRRGVRGSVRRQRRVRVRGSVRYQRRHRVRGSVRCQRRRRVEPRTGAEVRPVAGASKKRIETKLKTRL